MAETKTTTDTKARPTPPPLKPAVSQGQVAVLAPPRFGLPADVAKKYEIDEYYWRTLVDATFPNAKTPGAIIMAIDYCRARKLDIFKRPVHIVPIWSTAAKRMIETVWPGISEVRTTAMRTGSYAGMLKPEFGPMIKKKFTGKYQEGDGPDAEWKTFDVEVEFPQWCEITVRRIVQSHIVEFPGPRTLWLESYQRRGKSEVPNEMWQKRGTGQLEKCAEAAALRRAFPEELGEEWTADEAGMIERIENMQDITRDGTVVLTPVPAEEPKAKDFKPSAATTPADSGQAASSPPAAGGGDSMAVRKASSPAAKSEAATQPDVKTHTGKRKTKAKVTDVKDQNAGKETGPDDGAATQAEQAAAAGQPEEEKKPAEPLVFETNFESFRGFEDFSYLFLSAAGRTPDEAKQWKEAYRVKLDELKKHEFERIRNAVTDLITQADLIIGIDG